MSKITENWCNFVLNEGIIPSIIVRKLKSVSLDDKNLCIVIADVLNKRENADIAASIVPEKEMVKLSFKADPELTTWLDTMRELLDIIKNYSDKGGLLSNIVDEACLSFIKACTLVSDDRRQLYIGAKTVPYFSTSTNPDIKQAFREYLEQNQYSHNTINSYISGINKVGKLTNIQRNLWEISDTNEMRHLIANWENNTNHLYNDYKEQDLLSRKTLSNAVKRYAEFLNYQIQGK